MERPEVRAQTRPADACGKGAARKLRTQGLVPGVAYGPDMETMLIVVSSKELRRVASSLPHTRSPITLVLENDLPGGQAARTAILKEIQRHPITGQVLCVDFHCVSLTEKIVTSVPVQLVGQSEALTHGGILQHVLREIEVSCLPGDIPPRIEVDTSNLQMDRALHLSDVAAPPAVEFVTDPETVVAVMNPPAVEEAPPEEAPAEVAPAEEAAEAAGEEGKPSAPGAESKQKS